MPAPLDGYRHPGLLSAAHLKEMADHRRKSHEVLHDPDMGYPRLGFPAPQTCSSLLTYRHVPPLLRYGRPEMPLEQLAGLAI